MVSVAKDVGEAEKALKGIALDAETGTEERKVPVMAEKSGPSGTVALLLPRQGNFANICKKRVEDRGGKTFLYSSPPELLQALDTIVPDLVVIDQRIPGSEKLVGQTVEGVNETPVLLDATTHFEISNIGCHIIT